MCTRTQARSLRCQGEFSFLFFLILLLILVIILIISICDRHHPANEEEHKENRSQAEQLRTLVGGGVAKQEERGGEVLGALEGKDEGDGEARGWANQEEVHMVRRSGETEDEEEEKRKLEKAKMEEEEQEVKKLDEMIALREKEQERRRLEEKEMGERKAKEEKKEEAKVDEENNSIPVTPVRKVLSRTSSFEVKMTFLLFCTFSLQVIRSKTIILEETNERMERTTMNITQTKVFYPIWVNSQKM